MKGEPRVTRAELSEIRRMLAELDFQSFQPITWTPRDSAETYNPYLVGPRDYQVVGGCANAPVFADIVRECGIAPASADSMVRSVRRQLDGGRHTVWFGRVLAVARLRLAGDNRVSAPILPESEGWTEQDRAMQFAHDVEVMARAEKRAEIHSRYVANTRAMARWARPRWHWGNRGTQQVA